MGKSWVRGEAKPDIPAKAFRPNFQATRKFNVWTREPSTGTPQSGVAESRRLRQETFSASNTELNRSDVPREVSQTTGGEPDLSSPAKKRRLAAKGRLAGATSNTWQPQPRESPGNNQKESEPSSFLESSASEQHERQLRERQKQVLEEANALKRRIAEEEAKILAAKVSNFSV